MIEMLYISLVTGEVLTEPPNEDFRCFSRYDGMNYIHDQLSTIFVPSVALSITDEMFNIWNRNPEVTSINI